MGADQKSFEMAMGVEGQEKIKCHRDGGFGSRKKLNVGG